MAGVSKEKKKEYNRRWRQKNHDNPVYRTRKKSVDLRSRTKKYADPAWVAKKKEYARLHNLKTKFGITDEQYTQLLHNQNGGCAVCKQSAGSFRTRLAVDHDHRTRRIRGLLCFRCNKFVVSKHRDGRLLRSAADYLDNPISQEWLVPEKKRKRKRRK